MKVSIAKSPQRSARRPAGRSSERSGLRRWGLGFLYLAIFHAQGCHPAACAQPTYRPPDAAVVGPVTTPPEPARESEARARAQSLQDAFIEVAESVSRSVVTLRVEARRRVPNPFQGFPFGDFFGNRRGRGTEEQQFQVQRGMGSGVILRPEGFILTNRHVVEHATRVEVVFHDGTRQLGEVVGADDATDLAVVKVDATDLVPVTFADSDAARPGEWVIAIGSPFGLDYTVTVGVVSAVGRGVGATEIEDYLQTDASINPGNSGGPLVNLQGEVLGINTMIVGGGTGIGFAIPANLARNVAEQLIESGRVRRAFIGVTFQELTPELAQQFGVPGRTGALVSSVVPGGPAERAGIRPGDIVVQVDGREITESRDLQRIVVDKPIGARTELVIVREGRERTVSLITAERPQAGERPRRERQERERPEGELRGFGLSLRPLTPELARQLGYEGRSGILVAEVQPGSAAERAGLERGDLIEEADRQPVTSLADLTAALADDTALLRVRRRDASVYVVLSRSP